MARKLIVEVVADTAQFTKGMASSATAARGFSKEVKEVDKAARGAISGTGALSGFTKSLAFASGGFLAFEGVSKFLTDSISAARDAGVAQRQLAAQMKASGESFAQNRGEIEKTALSYGKFGFNNDQVIQSLTILERGTGNVNQAIRLQGLTADIARAKNIDLGAAASVVAKVFGHQETALRRAVPGLEKNAHGWDLIRLAQAKMAGQAAAGTTVSERFAATLHNTEEIIGTALLPILNKYLTSLSGWLDRMNTSGKLQKDVNGAVKVFNDVIAVTRTVLGPVVVLFKQLGDAVGGTRNELELLVGVFAGGKLLGGAAQIRRLGTEAEGAEAGATGLRTALLGLLGVSGLVGAGLIAGAGAAFLYMQKTAQDAALAAQKAAASPLPMGSGVETTLVPRLADQIRRMQAGGATGKTIIATLRQQLGGSLKADDLIGEAFSFMSGSDPALQARIRKQVAAKADVIVKTATDTIKQEVTKRTAVQRNTWFDALINRQLGAVQDIPTLQGQLSRLGTIGGLITKRIDATKDITRKLKLEDELLGVVRQEKGIKQQLAQQFLDGLQFNVDKAGLTATLTDDVAALLALQAGIRQRMKVEGDTLALRQQELAVQQQLLAIGQQQAATRKAAADAAKAAAKAAADQRKAAAQQREQTTMDWAQLALEKAQNTKGISDDIRALNNIIRLIRQQIRLHGLTVALARELYEAQQQERDIRAQARAAAKAAAKAAASSSGGGAPGRPTFLPIGFDTAAQYMHPTVYGGGGGSGGGGAIMSPMVINGGVHLHGVQDVPAFEQQLQKRAQARPQTRRGPV